MVWEKDQEEEAADTDMEEWIKVSGGCVIVIDRGPGARRCDGFIMINSLSPGLQEEAKAIDFELK
jgi:hypothetical protein